MVEINSLEITFEPFKILITIGLLYLIDVLSTYSFMKTVRKNFPEYENWADMELNPIVKFWLKKLGVFKGTIVSVLCTMPIILFMVYVAGTHVFFFGMIIGMYITVFNVHVHTWVKLYSSIKKKKEKEINNGKIEKVL
jgi:hypothetical protein